MPRKKALPDDTRARLLAAALALFQDKGVAATTMRDIARAAGMSLGAAYYYFPSKDALVFAYYEDNQAAIEARAAQLPAGSVREQLGAIFHDKLAGVAGQRKMLAAIVHRLVDPADPLSAFSAQQREVRERAIAVFDRAIAPANLPPKVAELASRALWLLLMGLLLVYVHDDSPKQRKTHRLADDALDLIVPMFPFAATPTGAAVAEQVATALARAGMI